MKALYKHVVTVAVFIPLVVLTAVVYFGAVAVGRGVFDAIGYVIHALAAWVTG